MFHKVSPAYIFKDLIPKICSKFEDGNSMLWAYLIKFQKAYDVEFKIHTYHEWHNDHLNAELTLGNIPNETLFKIAIDLGIEVPALVPAIPQKIELKIEELDNKFQLVHKQITEAIESCYKKPDHAISMMNTALETTCKRILEGNNNYNAKEHSTELIKKITKHIELSYDANVPQEIKSITSALLNIGKNIDDLRANFTSGQGKDTTQKIITDSNYAFFCVNAIASVILFLLSTEKPVNNHTPEDDIPF